MSRKNCSEIANCNLNAVEVDNYRWDKKEKKEWKIMEFSCNRKFKISFIYKYDQDKDSNPETVIISFDNEIEGIPVSDLVKEFGEWDYFSSEEKMTYLYFKFNGVKRKEKKYYTKIDCQNIFGSKEIMNCIVKSLRIENVVVDHPKTKKR